MECYETCADRGKRSVLSRERISCGDCGKFKPCYNIQSLPCSTYTLTEPCGCPKQEKEKEQFRASDVQTCKCKQSCWEWILAFLGIGGNLPDCCRNVQLTAWQSGEVARDTLVSKFYSIFGRLSGREQPQEAVPPSKTIAKQEVKEADKKTTASGPGTEEQHSQEINDVIVTQSSGKESTSLSASEKKGKTQKSHSTSSHRSRSKHRKGGSGKSRSISRETGNKIGKIRSSSSNSSTSISQGRKNRHKTQSQSSSVKVFNPFKQPQFKCPSPCTVQSISPPIICPPLQPRSFLSRLNEDQVADFPSKYASPSCQNMQTSSVRPVQIRRSNSMSYRPYQMSSKTGEGSSYPCPPACSFNPKPPCISQSFQSNQPKYSSAPSKPVSSVCAPPRIPRSATTVGHRTTSCLCFADFSKKSKCCHRPCSCATRSSSGLSNCCRSPYTAVRPRGCCGLALKPSASACPLCCCKPCCLSVPRMCGNSFNGQSNPHRQHQSPPLSCGNHFNICCSGAGCCCPTHPITPMSRAGGIGNATCGHRRVSPKPVSVSHMASKHSDAICEQLLSRYGYSPPIFPICPTPCYGSINAALCSSLSCAPMYKRPDIGGCRECRPGPGVSNLSRKCELTENLTNSRRPRSPEAHSWVGKSQMIEFNSSPCDRKPKCEFQLAPHCIRKTGPRSPVGEYLALLRVPKPVRRPPAQEEPILERLTEANAQAPEVSAKVLEVSNKLSDAKTGESGAKEPDASVKSNRGSDTSKLSRNKNIRQSRKKSKTVSEDRNTSANTWCADNKITFNKCQTCITRQDSPCRAHMMIVEAVIDDCYPPVDEGSRNNNYGGDSYHSSRYSSAGPMMIDFSDVSSHGGRHSNVFARSSASSSYLPHYSTYHSTTTNYDTCITPKYSCQPYSRDARRYSETCQFGSSRYVTSAFSNININAQKQYPEIRPPTIYNRCFNGHVNGVSESLKSSKYHVQLETAIENKIKELRESRRAQSPPARKRIFAKSLLGTVKHSQPGLYVPDVTDPIQLDFIRESWDTLNLRAERRRKNLIGSNLYMNARTPVNTGLISNLGSNQSEVKDQLSDVKDTSCMKHEPGLARGYFNQNDVPSFRETKPYIEATKQRHEVFNRTTPSLRMEDNCVLNDEKDFSCFIKDKSYGFFKDEKNNSYFKDDKASSLFKDEKNNSYFKDDKASSLFKDEKNNSYFREDKASSIFKDEKSYNYFREDNAYCLFKDEKSYSGYREDSSISALYEEKGSNGFKENKNDTVFKEDTSHVCCQEYNNNTTLREEKNTDALSENKSPQQTTMVLETTQKPEGKPASKMDCVPVLQGLFGSLEETVQLFVRSRKAEVSADAVQAQGAPARAEAETKDNAGDAGVNTQSDVVKPDEENQSSNRPDKSFTNQRMLSTVSSPPKKPEMSLSPEEDNSGGSDFTCSCQSNSGGTSTVSLKMSRSAASSSSVSESASCDSSLTFTKHNQLSRTGHNQPTDLNNYHAYISTKMSVNVSDNAEYPENCRAPCKTEPRLSHPKICNKNPSVTSPAKELCLANYYEGSSVDPLNIINCGNASGNTYTANDKTGDYYKSEDGPHVQGGSGKLNSTHKCGDTSNLSHVEANDKGVSRSESSPGAARSLDKLMRELIRRNGTPV